MKAKTLYLMLFTLVCSIAFGQTETRQGFIVKKVVSVEIQSSWQSLTDKATVVLPNKWLFRNKGIQLRDYVKKGDPISISLGYGTDINKRFEGYVSDIGSGIPTVLSCEDNMYKLKRTPVNFISSKTTLSNLLANIVPSGITVDALEANLGSFKASKTNVAKVLDKLKEKYGLVSYFKGNTLYCGKVHIGTEAKPKGVFHFEKNILENSLKYRSEDDYKLSVKAISNLLNGQKLEVQLGDEDGEERTLNYFNIETEAELKALAEVDFEKLKLSGYTGDFIGYGRPEIEHSDIVKIQSTDYPERNGNYFVDAVSVTFQANEYRQKLSIGKQV